MCLLKVFIEGSQSKEPIAKEVILAVKNGDSVELYDQTLNKVSVVENAEIAKVDMLNETLTLVKRGA